MIYVILGTKAQLIKMAPIMALMQERGIDYRFIFTGQHQETIDALRDNFSVKPPDIILHTGRDITSIPAMLWWVIKIVVATLRKRREMFPIRTGVVLVHGDTFSTLLGAIMGKLAGLKIAHVESGLRSFNIFHPFPEELTRLATFYLSDIYFCPGRRAVNNLAGIRGLKIDTGFNTLLDAVRLMREQFHRANAEIPNYPYCVVSTHRFENIFSASRLKRVIALVEQIAVQYRVLFVLHPVTSRKLEQFGLMARVKNNPRIELRPRYDYIKFLKLVSGAQFLATDGGSNQEECAYLGKPCLLLRGATERQEGLGYNVIISKYDSNVVSNFLQGYSSFVGQSLLKAESPSQIILDHLLMMDSHPKVANV